MSVNIFENFELLKDVNLIQELKSNILGLWPSRKDNNFPGPLPVSIERKNFATFKKFEYVISLKSNGYRFFLVGYNKHTYLVNRSFNFYKVNTNIDDSIYGSEEEGLGFLFDGELINNNTTFLIHDCACIYSQDIRKDNFYCRYEALKSFIDDIDSEKPSDFTIKAKKFYMFKEFNRNIVENTDHEIDGLIFTPVALEMGTKAQYTLFKWKECSNHTFDFLIKEEEYYYALYELVRQDITSILAKVKKTNKAFTNALKKNCPNFKSGDIVECKYDLTTKKFVPHLIRVDKPMPNSSSVIRKTFYNIAENITLDEIIQTVNN